MSCSRPFLLTEENISDFQSCANYFLKDTDIGSISRDLDDITKIYTYDSGGEKTVVDKLYLSFIERNETIGFITKKEIYMDYLDNWNTYKYISEESMGTVRGERSLKKRLKSLKKETITVVDFMEYNYCFLFGQYYGEGNSYAYSPDLDLSVLDPDELRVFGYTFARKTPFKNWYYTGPLG